MEYSDLIYACRISEIFGYNCRKARELLSVLSPSAIFSLPHNQLVEIFGEHSPHIDMINDNEALRRICSDVRWAEEHNIRIIYIGDRDYPYRLKECADAPIILYYRGNADLNSERVVSIVGTRKATPYGRDICRKIVECFTSITPKPLIISGLALGIDTSAHRAALDNGLPTIGVMATGLDVVYPSQNRGLAAEMVFNGGVLSDFGRKNVPNRINFLRRNRIIAGLSDAVILIESGEKGGGMVTSKMAHSYSREVFALPGKITDTFSAGCNLLIKDNIASLIHTPSAIIREMGWEEGETKKINPKPLLFESDNEIKRKILVALSSYLSLDMDTLISTIEISAREMTINLTELEMEGRIKVDLTGRFSIA